MLVCLHLCVHLCKYVCVHVCRYVCMCVHVWVCGQLWGVQFMHGRWVVGCAVTCGCVACVGGGMCSYLWVSGMCGSGGMQLSWMYEFLECGLQ